MIKGEHCQIGEENIGGGGGGDDEKRVEKGEGRSAYAVRQTLVRLRE